jgi:hypothetical protein
VSGFEIGMAVVGGLALLALLYAFVRVAWLLWQGDELVSGRDSDLFRRLKSRRDEPRV